MKQKLLEILHNEVKPALGCTEPIAVALAGAKARELLTEAPLSAQIIVSGNIYKNGMCVGIPGTNRMGLITAAALGIMGGDAKQGLQVLASLTPSKVKDGEDFEDTGNVKVDYKFDTDTVYIDFILKGANSEVQVIINQRHDNFVFLRKDKEILLDTPISKNDKTLINPYSGIMIKDIYETCKSYSEEELDFLWEGIEMNSIMAEYGMTHDVGAQVGNSLKRAIEAGDLADDFHNNAMMWTAAASDARMSGVNLPVMSSSSSGNHGLTAILPIAVYAKMNNSPRLKTLQALAMSHLLTSYIKSYTGRLSAMCGCGVAASTGTSFGLGHMMDLDYAGIERIVEMMVASISGIICDGAKASCAAKLAVATATAIENCIMAKQFVQIPHFNGIVGYTIEQSIQNLGTVCSKGMLETDKVILSVMNEMNLNTNS